MKAETEMCICNRWRKTHWPEGRWTDAPPDGPPPPPQHQTTPRTCPDCLKALRPTITRCSHCPAWRWYNGPVWYPNAAPTLELALASHGICPRCKKDISEGGGE